ncbi:MAG TPA: hypothetical protein VGB37_16480 [Candidatus Lokiarchaeia archaeon]
MNNQEKEQLKKWSLKFFENNQIGFDIFDFDAEIDNKLSLAENKTILREKISSFLNMYNSEKLKRKEAEIIPQEQYEIYTTELKKEKEEQAKQEFNNSLNKIAEIKTTDLLKSKFFLLSEYVNILCNGDITGLICIGETGTGKSYNILKALKENKKEFVFCSGFSTPLQLYNFLFENSDKIIFFDDTKNILKNEISIEILKSALFSPTGTRIVKYSSSSSKLKYPHQFIFNGKIILSLNDLISKQNEDLKAVLDRVLFYNIVFSYEEKLSILADLIKIPYKELTEDNRKYIFNWIKENTSKATINLNFRTLFKLYEVYRYNPLKFEVLSKPLIKTDKQQELILTLLKKNVSVKQAQEEFNEITGLSRVSFYRIKKEIYI